MKIWKAIALFLALSCLLSACGTPTVQPKAEPSASPAAAEAAAAVPGFDPDTGEWIGRGGSYRFVVTDENPGADQLILRDGKVYAMRMDFGSDSPRYSFSCGDTLLYESTADRDNLELAGQSAEGFWLHRTHFGETGRDRQESLLLLSPEGEILRELDLSALTPENGFLFRFGIWQERPWAVSSEQELLLLDADGGLTQRVSLPQPFQSPLVGGDGGLYLDDDNGQTQTLSRLEGESFVDVFSCPSGPIFPGDAESPFFLSTSDGLYRVSAQGETAPIVIFSECCLSLTGLYKLAAQEDGSFFCATPYCIGRLEPAEPAQLHPRTRLSFGYLGGDEFFKPNQDSIARYNLVSPDYYVDYVDLTEGGAYTDEQALNRLNTALTNGTAPDMLSLISLESGWLSPFPYSRKGLLVDLAERLEQDAEMSLGDIVIAPALLNDCGGIWFLCDRFTVTTYIADYERFGDRFGWSFEEYLDLDRTLDAKQQVFYNLTRDRFLEESASSFMRQAIDWNAGTCDFNNEGFLSLLNAAKNLRETPEPEDPDEMIFWNPNHIFDGTMVTEIIMLNDVSSMAAEQRLRGVDKLSFIGWPSFDGSCGSVIDLQSPFALFSTSPHPDGCWDFLKFTLRQTPDFGLPVYRPLLEQQLAAEQRDVSAIPSGNYRFTEPLTVAEAAQFWDFLGRLEHTSLCDQTAMEIIRAECEPFFRGDKSAEETAALIQSRLSLYVAEQA